MWQIFTAALSGVVTFVGLKHHETKRWIAKTEGESNNKIPLKT